MPKVDDNRLRALEGKFGASFPAQFVASLSEREPISQGGVAFVSDEVVWDIRTTFRLNGPRTDHSQLDRVYDLVGDVMPPGALPFAEDWAGNLYCLMIAGPTAGRVVYWDHEREPEDHHVDLVANSLDEFFDALVPDPGSAD